jgi:integrase
MPAPNPSATVVVREHDDQPFYEAKFIHRWVEQDPDTGKEIKRHKQVKRRIGPAWLDRSADTGKWDVRRKGRVPDGHYDQRAATVRAAAIAADYVADASDLERAEGERRSHGATFREVATDYLRWLNDVGGAKPATLRDHGYMLGEPGAPYTRGTGARTGHVLAALGDRPAAKITTREIDQLLTTVSATGASPRTVNKYRSVIAAAFSYGCKPSTFALPANPARDADRRREPHPGALVFYTPEEVEAVARALEQGLHRDPSRPAVSEQEREARSAEDHQDAELVRLAAYGGLRQGELLALHWRDVDFAGSALTVARAMSAGVEASTKSGRVRRVPLSDQAAAALDRVSRRENFVSRDDLVFANVLGRTLDDSALRRRYRRAQAAAGVRPLRFHDLRHTFGSLLAVAGVDVVTIKAAMGHSALATTARYLHARPASEQAQAFTRAFQSNPPDDAKAAAIPS